MQIFFLDSYVYPGVWFFFFFFFFNGGQYDPKGEKDHSLLLLGGR